VLLIATGLFQKIALRTVSTNKSMSATDAVLVRIIQGFKAADPRTSKLLMGGLLRVYSTEMLKFSSYIEIDGRIKQIHCNAYV